MEPITSCIILMSFPIAFYFLHIIVVPRYDAYLERRRAKRNQVVPVKNKSI